MCALIVFLAVWYYVFVTGAQRFSPSEQKTVFRLHVYQFNMKKNKLKEESSTGVFAYLRSVYATTWNKFDKATKRISKGIDEKMDERYTRAWQYCTNMFYPSPDGAGSIVREGLSMKSEYSIVGRRSLAESNQVYIAPPPAVIPVVPSNTGPV